MKKTIFLGMVCLLVWILAVSADERCYQESANVSTSCGGLSTGEHTVDGVWQAGSGRSHFTYDEDWDTAGRPIYGPEGTTVNFYVNYTVPNGALSSSLWQLKYRDSPTANYSIPSDCWNETLLRLRVYQVGTAGGGSYWFCWNNTLSDFSQQSFGTSAPALYEEAMWWDFGEQISTECDYYVGDNEFNLPQITTTKTYDDSPTHKMYLACLYSLNGDSGYESMLNTQTCRKDIHTFNPNTKGNHTYNLAIVYRERQWNQTSHQWKTISEGTDSSLEINFAVCDIPDDPEGWQGFIDWITNLLCQWFEWFC